MVREGGLHGAGEDEELPDEAVEHGQADDGERGDDEEGDGPGEFGGEAAVLAHVVGGVALEEEAHEDEEGRATDAFVEGLVDAAVYARDGEGEDAEDDDVDMAQGSVGGEALEVLLDEGEERAVDDADGPEGDEQGSDVAGLNL